MTREVVLISGDGDTVTLACPTDPAWPALRSSNLAGLAPHVIDARPISGGAGDRVDGIRYQARTFAVPVLISGGTEAEVDARVATLGRMLRADREVRIRYRRDDTEAATRELVCRYVGGGEDIVVAHRQTRHVPIALRFTAHDPFWVDVATDDADSTLNLPFSDGAISGIDKLTLVNRGDVDCWPTILVQGPAQNIELMNVTTGRTVRLVRNLPVGEQVRIDTEPANFSVLLNNWPHYHLVVDPTTDWWPLRPGRNQVRIRAITLGGNGRFQLWWRPRFHTC